MAKGRQKPVFDIDINDVYYQLHETAMENSKDAARAIGCVIMNTGVNEKGKSYFGSGQYDVQCVLDSEDKGYAQNVVNAQDDVAKFRKSCFDVMKKYVEFFLSDAAEKMTEDQLIEVRAPKNEIGSVEAANAAREGLRESVRIDYRKSLVENLFSEADEPVPPDEGADSAPPLAWGEESAEEKQQKADREADKRKSELEQSETDTKLAGGDLIGYRWRYDNVVAGRTPADWKITGPRWVKNATSAVAKRIGGTASKLAGILGGVTVHTMAGDVTATAKGAVDAVGKAASLAGKAVSKAAEWASKYIDKDEFANAVYSNFRKDYPQSDISEVRAYLSQSLENEFRQQKKLTSDLKKRLQDVEFPIVVQVSPRSKDYANIDVNVVADEIKKSYGPWYKRLADLRGLKLAVSQVAKNIIKVSGVKSIYKVKSSYDQDLKHQIRQYALDAANVKSTVKSKAGLQESDVDSAVSGILAALFEDELNEKKGKENAAGNPLPPDEKAELKPDFKGRAEQIRHYMMDSKYRPYLKILLDGFVADKKVTDDDVKDKAKHLQKDPYLKKPMSDLAKLKPENGGVSDANSIKTKKEFINVLNYLTSPVDVNDLTQAELANMSPDEQKVKRAEQAAKRQALEDELDKACYQFLAIHLFGDTPSSNAVYNSLNGLFNIVIDFIKRHGSGDDKDGGEYDMYVYFDSNIRDLEDEGKGNS